VALACAIGFAVLALVVNEQGAIAFDEPVIAFVKGLPVPTDVWRAITEAGGVILVPIGIGLVAYLFATGRRRTAVIYGVVLAAASLWTHLAKVAIGRLRPPDGAVVAASGYSFPSGHSLNSTVTYGLIALLVWRSALPVWARRATVIVLALLVGLIGLSRIALGVHYPSDVLGGWLAGLAIVATVATFTGDDPDGET
jgi:undecaprenyl-diphosphatase